MSLQVDCCIHDALYSIKSCSTIGKCLSQQLTLLPRKVIPIAEKKCEVFPQDTLRWGKIRKYNRKGIIAVWEMRVSSTVKVPLLYGNSVSSIGQWSLEEGKGD